MSKLTITISALAAAAIGYAVYFDHQRRSSPEFRRSLKKQAKQYAKQESNNSKAEKAIKLQQVKAILTESLINDPLPTENDKKEEFFMTSVTLGEQLASIPGNEIKAALAFYRALSVYPNPTDILGIYQRSVPQDVYEIIIMMIAVQPPLAVASMLSESLDAEQD